MDNEQEGNIWTEEQWEESEVCASEKLLARKGVDIEELRDYELVIGNSKEVRMVHGMEDLEGTEIILKVDGRRWVVSPTLVLDRVGYWLFAWQEDSPDTQELFELWSLLREGRVERVLEQAKI